MPTYRVTGPDGKTYRINAPDGASQDEVLAYAQQQFGGQKKPAAPAEDPMLKPDDPGALMAALIGAGRTTDQIIDGMKQLGFNLTGNRAALDQLAADQAEKARLYKPLQDQHSVATAIGEALPGAVIPAGGGATLAGTAARLAASGAIPAALEYGSVGERAGRAAGGAAGAVAGGVVLPAAGRAVLEAVPAIGRTARAVVEPLTQGGREAIVGRTLNRAAGDDAAAAAAAARLGGAAPLVPGSVPTVAQVAENGGLAALERAVASRNPAPFAERGMEQAAARTQALRGIAQDEGARAAAVAAREAATTPLYQQATRANYTVDPALDRLLQTPAVQQAMNRARTLAENNQRPFRFDVEPPLDPFAGVGGSGVRQTATRQITGQGLQDLKMAMDEMLADPAAGFTGAAGNSIRELRGQLLNWMERANPDFRAARTTFADMSRPINQMDIGQELLQRLEPALADHGALARETGNKYALALRNADQTARTATGFRGSSLADTMTPEQMATLNGVAQDLARKANAQDLGRGPGSNTFQNFAMDNIAGQSGAPRVLGAAMNLPGVSKVGRFLYSGPEEQIQTRIGEALLDPQMAARLMAANRPAAAIPASQVLLSNPARATQLLGGGAGLATANLFAQ